MNKKFLFLALLGLPQLSVAQTGSGPAQFYVGAGASLLTDSPFRSSGETMVGPALTAGIQMTPRLAVQVSASYHWQYDSYTYPNFTYGSGIPATNVLAEFRRKHFTVPILLRYTFTEPTSAFHLDGLAGATILHSSFKSTLSGPSGGYGYYPDNYSNSTTKANFTLGPAVRYSIAPSVELTASGLVSAALGDSDGYRRFSDRLFLNVLIGAHYTFGAR